MWFSEKALVFVDTRSAAIAVYRENPFGRHLLRFGSQRFASRAKQGGLFADVLADSREAVKGLVRDLAAPPSDATLLLPIGASFPSVVDLAGLRNAQGPGLDEEALVRFRLAPLLPYPIAQAEVRAEASNSIQGGSVIAQGILRSTIAEGERVMGEIGFQRIRVTSALSAALRGLTPKAGVVDLIFGDSACAVAVRDAKGAIAAIHLRLLVEGDERGARSIDEAVRAAPEGREIRVLGEDVASLTPPAGWSVAQPSFNSAPGPGGADPRQFPFLSVFHEGDGR
jgi:hypothetical protein